MTNRRTSRRRRTRRTQQQRLLPVGSGRVLRELLAIALVLAAIVSTIAIFAPDAGFLIRPWHGFISYLLGWGIVLAPPLLAAAAVMLWLRVLPGERWLSVVGAATVGLALLGMLHLAAGNGEASVAQREGGGWLGFMASAGLVAAVGAAGAWALLALALVVGFALYFNVSLADLVGGALAQRSESEPVRTGRQSPQDAQRRGLPAPGGRTDVPPVGGGPGAAGSAPTPGGRPGLLSGLFGGRGTSGEETDREPVILRRVRGEPDPRPAVGPGSLSPPVQAGGSVLAKAGAGGGAAGAAAAVAGMAAGSATGSATALAEPGTDGGELEAIEVAAETMPPVLAPERRTWDLPPLDLLADAAPSSVAQLDLAARGQLIRQTLANFKIGVKVARIQEGPVVTQYALDVEPGIKLSRIEGLADNLALALSARSIRIEAPIPGEPYVGIEIPNTAFDLVTLKEVLASPTFEEASDRSKLAFALGQDVAGSPFAADLARMPHLLIAGATGSGKSVCVNALICSLLARATPQEVNLILIDPKRVEMAQYRGIPHLLCEVITDPEKAVNALKWTVGTMESRYHEFAQRGVRNIAGYNAALSAGEPPMPYIVMVIDELADLMMVSAYEVEATVTRVAQLARATGIHLVVATQRPSVQVITGLIKANIPSRVAFAMTSGIDSRTILDTTGAEDLLGRGDMLYQPIDAPRPVRLQGVLVTDAEIDRLARHWREQGAPAYRSEITETRASERGIGEGDDEDDDGDPLLRQAVEIVRRSDKASASLLQRRLRIGYARAARILDQMEDRGIVGAADGSRFREVLLTSDGWGGDIAPGERER